MEGTYIECWVCTPKRFCSSYDTENQTDNQHSGTTVCISFNISMKKTRLIGLKCVTLAIVIVALKMNNFWIQ